MTQPVMRHAHIIHQTQQYWLKICMSDIGNKANIGHPFWSDLTPPLRHRNKLFISLTALLGAYCYCKSRTGRSVKLVTP